MASARVPEPMNAEDAGRLAEFARACKAAIRVVAMYPPTHPNIQAALDRMVAAGAAATERGPLTIAVRPDTLLVSGRLMPRPDAAVDELAVLLHRHQVGELTLQAPLTPEGWHALLTLLATAPEDIRAEGGLHRAWQGVGGGPVDIREIDYAEVLKDRGATNEPRSDEDTSWDELIATCLAGDNSSTFDGRALASLLDIGRDPERLADFLARLQDRARASGQTVELQKTTLRRLLQRLADFVASEAPDEFDAVMDNVASGATCLSPELLMSLLSASPSPAAAADGVDVPGELRARFGDDRLAAFVAENVIRDRGASSRLAEAFHALAPDEDVRRTAMMLAEERVSLSSLADDPQFHDLWSQSVGLLMSYSDQDYVPDEYGRELDRARARAVDIEAISDDPPDRVAAWLATVADSDVRALDQQLLVDLLSVEDRAEAWTSVLDLALTRLDQLLMVGDLPLASDLVAAVTGVAASNRSPFASQALAAVEGLVEGPLVPRLMPVIRSVDEKDMPRVTMLCQVVGPGLIRPFIAALSTEESRLAVRRVKDLLVTFGSAARDPARALRDSSNPAVRRVAIEILRDLGGDDALGDLRDLLADADPHVQREALRAVLQIGTSDAYALLEEALAAGDDTMRQAVLHTLGSFSGERAVPLLGYLIEHSSWRGKAAEAAYIALLEALGRSGGDRRGVDLLKSVLYRGEWWAPFRTARIRSAAARALHATASPAGDTVLAEAIRDGSRGVRQAAAAATALPRRANTPGASR